MTTKFTLKRGRCDPDDPYGATLTRISFSFKLRFSISIFHNTPCFPQNISISIVLSFSWDHCNSQEKVKPFFFFIFKGGGVGVGETRCIMGDEEMTDCRMSNKPMGAFVFLFRGLLREFWKSKSKPFLFTRNDLTDALSQINALYLINGPSTLLSFY